MGPPLDIQKGVITLRVIEPKMDNLIINDDKWFSEQRIEYYWSIDEGDLLGYGKMSKALDFMNRNPDRHVEATLKSGEEPGTTDLVMDDNTRFPVHGFMTFDRKAHSRKVKNDSATAFSTIICFFWMTLFYTDGTKAKRSAGGILITLFH